MANTIQLKRGTGSSEPSTLAEGELAINLDSGKLFYGSGSSVLSDFTVNKLTAETYVVSSSVTHMTTSFSSGSTAFGDSAGDAHTFTGDITASGIISASGDGLFNNVGIRTTPAQPLHVAGNARVDGDFFIIESNPQIFLSDTNHNSDFSINLNAGLFKITDTTNAADRITLDSSGNVGIGNSNPTEKLTVEGNISASGNVYAADYFDNGVNINTIYQPTLTFGIADTNVLRANANVADNDFLRVDGTSIEGRTAAQVRSDIGAASTDALLAQSAPTDGAFLIADDERSMVDSVLSQAGTVVSSTGNISSSANIYAADYFDNGVNINTIYSPIASPTFTGTVAIPNIANVETAITANTAKATNVSTNLTATTHASQITINSSDGDNVVIAEASDTIAGVMSVAHHDKLDGIEASADVTDATNVTAAGALMDSELTDLAGVKGVTISTLQVKPSEGAFANGDKTKLDGIATNATADQDQSDINGLAITTVGALGSGTIASGFGNIDNGTSTINTGEITASGDISASGTISAEHFYSSDDIVAAGDISASAGNVYGASVNTPRINPEGATNVYISAGIQVIGDITGSTTITVPSRVYAHPGTNAGDHTAGDVWYFGGTTGMTAGLIYYLNTSGTWTVTNCDDVDDSTGMLAVALGDESDNDGMLLRGFVTLYEIQGTEDHGKILYLNQTDGGTSIVAPTTSGHVVRIIGYAIHNTNDSVYFNPDNTWVEIA